jgi:putative permease
MKRLAILTATAVATLAGAWLLWQFRSVLLLFLLSLGLAAALRPLVDGLERAGHWPRPAALLAVYGLTLAVIIAVIVATSGPLLDDLRRSADQFVLTYDTIWVTWPVGSPFQQSIVAWLPPPQDLYAVVTGAQGAAIAQSLLGVTLSLVDLISRVSIVVVMSIYWGMDQARFERLWLSLLAAGRRARALEIWRAMETGLGAYLRSELIQSMLAGLLLGAGYRLLQMPYPALLATTSAVVWLVPWLGAVLGLGFVLLAGLAAGPWITLAACVYTVLVFALLEFVVEPRLYNRRQFSSLLVVLLVIALWNAVGLLGLLAAPPLAAALQILVTNLLTPGAIPVAQPIEQRFAALEDRLATLDASLGAAPKAPSPQVANLVSRLGTLLSKARQALSNQGALAVEVPAPDPRGVQPATAPPASAAPSAALSEARRR